ncbi:MAG: hypothetical protein U1F66_02005 [bacterium]
MATMTEKIQQVKKLLSLVPNQARAVEAEGSYHSAERLMQEIEHSMLANPFLQEEDLANLVRFTRGPLWTMARRHVETLRRSA